MVLSFDLAHAELPMTCPACGANALAPIHFEKYRYLRCTQCGIEVRREPDGRLTPTGRC